MDDQSQDDSENVTTASTAGQTNPGSSSKDVDPSFNPSPEVLFLIKSHAKTISAINKISKKLEQLEVKVCDISKQSSHSAVSEATKCNAIDKCHHSCAAHVLSDDSGGEYSRSTTNGATTDEDELMSLLDQIGKCSQSIRETRQVVNNQSSLSRLDPHLDVHHVNRLQTVPIHSQHGNNNQRLTSASGHPLQSKSALYSSPAINHHNHSPTVHLPFNPSHHVSWNQRPHHLLPPPLHPSTSSPSSSTHLQPSTSSSLNALLFDPNVSRIINSFSDEVLIDDPNKFLYGPGPSHAEHYGIVYNGSYYHQPPLLNMGHGVPGTSRPGFQRSLPTNNHHHQLSHLPSHDLNQIPASIATSTPVSSDRGRRRWEMDRALQLVQKRAQDTVEVQYDMADQWLARQMNSKSQQSAVTSSSPHSSQGSSVSTVTLRSPATNPSSVKSSSQIPSTSTGGVSSRSTGQKVTINSAPLPSQIQVTSNNSSSTQLSPSTDIRHTIVNNSSSSAAGSNPRQQSVRSYHLSPPVTTTTGAAISDSSQSSGLKGSSSSASSSVATAGADVGSSLRKQAPSSRYNSNHHNHNSNSISKR